jgi:hypothetical protein
VRGDDDDPSTARAQAEGFRRRYPDWHRFGLSAFYAEDDDAVDDLAADLLERFPILRIYVPAALSAEGIEVVPTFRSPHVTLAFAELDTGLEVLETAPHERRENPYHEAERTPT